MAAWQASGQNQVALSQMAEQKATQRYAAAVRVGNEHREALEASRKAELVSQAKVVELERALMKSESALLKQGTLEGQIVKLQEMLIHATTPGPTPR